MTAATTTTDSDDQQLLSHLAAHLLHELGGSLPLETLHLRVTDYLDHSGDDVAALIEQGKDDGIYRITRTNDALKIIEVSPMGDRPDVLAGLTTESGAGGPAPTFDDLDAIGETTANRLRNAGYDSFRELYDATPDALTNIPTMTEAKATHIIEQAGQFVTPDFHLAHEALERYHRHSNRWDDTQAIVQPLLEIDQDVGQPLALTDTAVAPEQMHYHGLPVLTDVNHPHMVRAADFPQDDTETPIAPKPTTMSTVGLETDVATAQKLARGNRGLRLVGPHGCGKNYTLKYLHYQTNRVLVSIDADSSMLAQDVLGVSTVNEDRMVVFRDGVLTKAMKHGYTVVINEGNVVPPGVMMALQEVLNENVLTVKESGETIIPHPAARIVITMNPPTREYRGSEAMNAATRDRFQTVYFDYLDEQDEIELLDQLANASRQRVNREDIRRLVEVAAATRTNETWPTLSTRTLEHAIDWIDEGASVRGALKHVVQAAADPHQAPADTHETIDDV
jgi:nitric oxide reductase NorQ protein